MTMIAAAPTRRLSPRRPTATSPDSPDADSSPVKLTVATPSANTVSPHVGVSPRWMVSVIVSRWKKAKSPRTMTSAWRPRSATTRAAIRFTRVLEKPRMLRIAT